MSKRAFQVKIMGRRFGCLAIELWLSTPSRQNPKEKCTGRKDCIYSVGTPHETVFYLSRVRANDRATEFRSRCRQLGIAGVTLHSYRYAWAERAKTAGYPERFAQEALGHNSKAVHRAYAKRALMKIPSLEEYEQRAATKVESAV